MSDREGEMTWALRAEIRRMDVWLSGMESFGLEFTEAQTKGATERRCRAVLVFDRVRLNVEAKMPGAVGRVRVEIDNAPLHEVERDGD